jgi:hypothetical protein
VENRGDGEDYQKKRAATTMPRHGLEHHCPDLNGWQRSWVGLEKDLPLGEHLITLFRPFSGTFGSVKTVQKHVGNLCGEFNAISTTTFSEKAAGRAGPLEDDRIRGPLLFEVGRGGQLARQ